MSETPGPKSGTCPRCHRPTGGIKTHARFCLAPEPTPADQRAILRAGAHAAAETVLRPAQRFLYGVTDLDVTRVMHKLEQGTHLTLDGMGRWRASSGSAPERLGARTLSTVVQEMIRTGLVRHWRDREGDRLIPAKVHLRNSEHRTTSACLFTGENMGPMRSRLVDDLVLVDCLDCEQAVATGRIPRL